MVFSQREKIIVAATLAVLCVLVLDLYVLTPLLDEWSAAEAKRTDLSARMARAGSLIKRRRILGRTWRSMIDNGLKADPAEAESQILRSLRNWAYDARLNLSSLRPERSTEKTELPEITVHAAGTGSMSAVSRLLWRVETAKIPIKIRMLQLGSRKDGTDDLSLHLKISTLYSPPDAASANEPAKRRGALRGSR